MTNHVKNGAASKKHVRYDRKPKDKVMVSVREGLIGRYAWNEFQVGFGWEKQ